MLALGQINAQMETAVLSENVCGGQIPAALARILVILRLDHVVRIWKSRFILSLDLSIDINIIAEMSP